MTTDRAAAHAAGDQLPFDDGLDDGFGELEHRFSAVVDQDAVDDEDELFELSPPGADVPCADWPAPAAGPAPLDGSCVDDRSAADEPDGGASSDAESQPVEHEVEIRPSARRKRTVTAYREGNRTVVLVPARMSRREQERHAAELVARLDRRETRSRPSDAELVRRAAALSRRWLDGRAKPATVRWVDNQRSRWGSCTPVDASIRLSSRLQGMPDYVVDAVLLHELAHLLEPNHSPEFWALLAPFPDHERANAYLEGVAFGAAHLRES